MVTSVENVPTKTQMGLGTSLTATFPFFDTIGPGFSIFLSNIWPSDASGWVVVRGYYEIGLSAFVLGQARLLSLADIGDFRAGGRAGMSASIAGYTYSTLVFYMPSIDLAGFFTWTPASLPNWDFSVAIPLRWLLRRDVRFSGSFGLEIGVSFAIDQSREPAEVEEEEAAQ